MMRELECIAQTQQWIEEVVIGMNFCPFAKREIRKNSVRFVLNEYMEPEETLQQLMQECAFLDANPETETTLLILDLGFEDFETYLDFIELSETLLAEHDYEGVYQIASFHPAYCFEGSYPDDAANYTNRSPYPMLHLLREASLERAIDDYPNVDDIPEQNIKKARELGVNNWKQILQKITPLN